MSRIGPRDCPCCGKPGKVKFTKLENNITLPDRGWVGCPECGLYIQWVYSPEGAIYKWNKRVSDKQVSPISNSKTYDILYEEGGLHEE